MREFWKKLRRWEKALLLLVALYLALWPLEPYSSFVLAARIALQIAVYFTGSVVVIRIVAGVVRALVRRFLWRVRHRMIVVYLFVGVIPLTLALTLAGVGLVLFFGPIAAYIVTSRLEQRAVELYATAASLGWELRAAEPTERRQIAGRFLQDSLARFPGLLARFDTPRGPAGFPPGFSLDEPPAAIAHYRGVVLREGQLFVAAHAQYAQDSAAILLMIPLTDDYLAELLPGFGIVELGEDIQIPGLAPRTSASRRPSGQALVGSDSATASGIPPGVGADRIGEAGAPNPPSGAAPADSSPTPQSPPPSSWEEQERLHRHVPPPAHPFDYPAAWPAQVPVLDWATGEVNVETAFFLRTRPSAVARLMMSNQSPRMTQMARTIGYVLGGMFAAAVVFSFIIAVSVTRTLTGSIHDLYVGTLHVDRGDFSHRVPVRGDNQLTELARSFNNMTASIERLIEDSRERQRLESELEIAREVQAQLFPRAVPSMKSLEMLGVCRPARTVSGDFYDYVELSRCRLALAFGDVSGKGISAALVMATLHSIVRTQLSVLAQSNGDARVSTAEMVASVNAQLFTGTSPEKFSTLFFGSYDESDGVLSYSNAGHLPPVLIRAGEIRRLDVSGMVVGAFPQALYESSTVELKSGDLFVAFTDGITEPENPYGEEYGERRLFDLLIRESGRPVQEIIERAMAEVIEWTGQSALQDDMTMLVARRR
jgi:sigma-B regulation protein RsbU (phosphoserine phosphatase)